MYHHSLCLKEFVEPVPICQAETNLGDILSIFQHSNCKTLAISQGKLDWGVINSEDLLSLVAEVWLRDYPASISCNFEGYTHSSVMHSESLRTSAEGDRQSVTGHSQNSMYPQSKSCRLIPDVKTLIEPAVVYQAETKLDTFLSQLKYGSLLTKERVCLIVDRQGKLQGKLDRDKIIKYLASKPFAVENVQIPSSLHYLTALLEAIVLPSKIETTEGQVIYTNQLWRQLTSENQNQNIVASKSPSVYSEVELEQMTKWLIDQQRVSLSPHPQEDNQASAHQLKVLEDSLRIQTSQVSSWNYLKIPLISDRDCPEETITLKDISAGVSHKGTMSFKTPSDRDTASRPKGLASASRPANSLEQITSCRGTSPQEVAYPKDNRQVYTHSGATHSNSLRASSKNNRQQITTGEPHSLDNLTYNLILAIPQIQSHSSTNNEPIYTPKSFNHQLLATISHELKSPLTGIIGLTSLLQGQKLGNLNQRQTRYAELIYRSGKKMMSVVDDLLQLTALTADPPRESELINLEFLCRQLYQEVLTKTPSVEERLNSSSNLTQLRLSIEPDNKMAIAKGRQSIIANKLLLSSVLSHLMLEALVAGEAIEPLQIRIKSLPELIAIVITGQTISATSTPGLNFTIAECLSELLEAQLTHTCSTTSCEITLLLPQKKYSILASTGCHYTEIYF
jgi:hypothetical protein